MRILFAIMMTLSSASAFADVACTVSSGWSIQFLSGNQHKFEEAYQFFKDGSKSDADVTIQQVYESPSEFKARVELDGQDVHIRTDLARRKGEFAIYTGTLSLRNVNYTVTCKQN